MATLGKRTKKPKSSSEIIRQRNRTMNNKLRAIDKDIKATHSEAHALFLQKCKAKWISGTKINKA